MSKKIEVRNSLPIDRTRFRRGSAINLAEQKSDAVAIQNRCVIPRCRVYNPTIFQRSRIIIKAGVAFLLLFSRLCGISALISLERQSLSLT